jgi:hypothetical protein
MLRSRAGLPRGGAALLVGTIAWLSVAVLDFPPVAMAGALGATLGAAVADIALMRLRTSPADRPQFALILAAGTAVLVWSGQLVALARSLFRRRQLHVGMAFQVASTNLVTTSNSASPCGSCRVAARARRVRRRPADDRADGPSFCAFLHRRLVDEAHAQLEDRPMP